MATQRQTKKAGGRRKKAARTARRSTGARQRRPAGHGARAGARQARREEAALEVQRSGPRLVAAEQDQDTTPPEQGNVERWREGSPGIPSFAQAASSEGGGPDGGPAVPTGREESTWSGDGAAAADSARREAGEELARWREQAEAARRRAGERELPGFTEIGMEIALGALRLARTILTAPLRIGLAFLRPRDVAT
jgi:hypothetical protein